MTAFATTFKALVMPQLRTAAKRKAILVVHGWCEFTEAADELMSLALSRGAGQLDDDLFHALEDRIWAMLLEIVAEFEQEGEAYWSTMCDLAEPLAASITPGSRITKPQALALACLVPRRGE